MERISFEETVAAVTITKKRYHDEHDDAIAFFRGIFIEECYTFQGFYESKPSDVVVEAVENADPKIFGTESIESRLNFMIAFVRDVASEFALFSRITASIGS